MDFFDKINNILIVDNRHFQITRWQSTPWSFKTWSSAVTASKPDRNSPVDNFAASFASHHRQQRLTKVTVCCWVTNDVITEDHQTQVVYIVDIVLLDVDTILHQSATHISSHYSQDISHFWTKLKLLLVRSVVDYVQLSICREIVHCEPIKHTKMFLSYLPPNPVDSDKIWSTLFWINLRYSSLNVFQLTWVMSLQYLVKLSVRVL